MKYFVLGNNVYEIRKSGELANDCLLALMVFPYSPSSTELIPKELVDDEGGLYETKWQALQQVTYTEKDFRNDLSAIIGNYCIANNLNVTSIYKTDYLLEIETTG